MNVKSKINKLSNVLSDETIDYVSGTYLEYVFHGTDIDLSEVTVEVDGLIDNLTIVDTINGNGKPDTMFVRSEIVLFLESEKVQSILNEKQPKQTRSPRIPQLFNLGKVHVKTLSNDTVDCLNFMFEGMVLSFGFPIQLQYILPKFREYNNNQEMRKKDLSTWLLKTGVFVKTPTGLYTYINEFPLNEVIKQYPENFIEGDVIDDTPINTEDMITELV